MPIKVLIDKLEDVDEAQRGLYKQHETKFVLDLDGIDGHPTVKQLRHENGERRIENSGLKKKYEPLGDRKPEEILALLDRIPELEATVAAQGDPKKIDDLVTARLKTHTAPIERERDNLRTQVVERDGIITTFKTRETQRVIQDAVNKAIAGSKGFEMSAAEDALMLAERIFEVGDDGKVIVKDKAGYTPGIDPAVWLTEIQSKRPHWWGPSQGGGSGGNRNNGGGGNNPWAHDTWNMTEQGKVVRENPARAEQLAKSAGTTVGGLKPVPRK